MAGGEETDFEEALPLFEAVGKNIFHTGECGTGQLTKCVNQVVVANTVAAMTEGLVLAKESGLSPEKTLDIIAGGAAGSWSLNNYGPRVLARDLAPGFDARHMLKDIDFALDEAKKLGASLPASERVRSLFDELCQKVEKKNEVVGNHGLIRLYEKN
jgi:3-hydroxyisobutyrate dehydrogenase